jgi:hypothetical protein
MLIKIQLFEIAIKTEEIIIWQFFRTQIFIYIERVQTVKVFLVFHHLTFEDI